MFEKFWKIFGKFECPKNFEKSEKIVRSDGLDFSVWRVSHSESFRSLNVFEMDHLGQLDVYALFVVFVAI